MIQIRGKNTLITGASSGIGKYLAKCFARKGARLFLAALPQEMDELESWAKTLEKEYNVPVWTMGVDLTGKTGAEDMISASKEAMGDIDILVNNAGMLVFGKFSEASLEAQEKMITLNFTAYMKCMRLVLPAMVEKGEGCIFNVGSASGFQPSPYHAVYGATKAAIIYMTRAVNSEFGGRNIRLFSLNPSYTDTPLLNNEGSIRKKLFWYKISGLPSPEKVAEKGFDAFLKGRSSCIPGWQNWLIHFVLARFLPDRLLGFLGRLMLK